MSSADGHRQRVRTERLKHGFLDASDRLILECLLFYCYPRRDTQKIAHKLIDDFGSLDNILNKKPQELISDCGFTENTALLFTLISDITKRKKLKENEGRTFDTPTIVGEHCVELLRNESEECLYVICLNSKMKHITSEMASSGDLTTTTISVRKITQIALKYNARGVILAHNHPSGDITPSKSDVSSTKKIMEVLSELQIEVYDHIIVNRTNYFSLLQNGYM